MRTVDIRLLRDGTGRVCIHYFVENPSGPIKNPSVADVPLGQGSNVKIEGGIQGAQGYIACNKKQNTVLPQQQGDRTLLCCHSNEARAVTCPECMKTPEWTSMMATLEGIVETANQK